MSPGVLLSLSQGMPVRLDEALVERRPVEIGGLLMSLLVRTTVFVAMGGGAIHSREYPGERVQEEDFASIHGRGRWSFAGTSCFASVHPDARPTLMLPTRVFV